MIELTQLVLDSPPRMQRAWRKTEIFEDIGSD
jgi:hypothetical protein